MTELRLPALVIDAVSGEALADGLYLLNRSPAVDETGAPRGTEIVFDIEEIADSLAGINAASIVVTVDGETAWTGGAAGSGWSGSVGFSNFWETGLRVSLTRAAAFASQDEITVSVQASTVGGARSLDDEWTFTVEDYTLPRLVGALATELQVVRLTFDEPIRLDTDAAVSFAAATVPAVPISASTLAVDGSTLVVTLTGDASPGALYTATVSGILDITGNEVAAPDNVASFAGFTPARPAARRWSLWGMLPRANRRDDENGSGDLARFIACLQEVCDLVLGDIDTLLDQWDIDRCKPAVLDLILADLGNPFGYDFTDSTKRRLAGVLLDIYRSKGTAKGIENAVQFITGITVDVLANRQVSAGLGLMQLDVDFTLGTSDSRTLYSFRVVSPVVLTDEQREYITMIVNFMRPAHTHFTHIEEPVDVTPLTSWVLDVSTLGETTILEGV